MQQACWAARWAAAAVVGAPPVRAIRSGIHARRQMWAPVRWGHSGAKRNGEPTGGSKPNRAKRGLFGGKVIQSGNNVSFSINRNKRVWKPNAHEQKLYSELLGCKLKVMVTASMLRTIDKHGGLDNYLLKTSDEKIDSDVGVKFKRMLEARLRQLEQEKNREGGRKGGHAADAPAAPGVAWTEAEEAHLTRLVEQVRRAEGIVLGAGDWRRVALELGLPRGRAQRSPTAVRVRWERRLSPIAAIKHRVGAQMKAAREEERLAMIVQGQQDGGVTRRQALHALRKSGAPGARWGQGGRKGDRLVKQALRLLAGSESADVTQAA